jgi:ATP-binding cassette subfamily F protein 3
VLELRGVAKRYGALRLFEGLDFAIERGDRIAFVGVNGAGKSTLARILAGTESIDAGERRVGYGVSISYFAQHQAEELDPSLDALQTLDSVAVGDIRRQLRGILGCFLFRGDDVFKQVAVLSGGEKSRLALSKMLLRQSNLIVLDEPTNHLDIRSKAILQEALQEYGGSFVIVSHDRDFVDPLVTKVLEVKEGRIRTYLGNVSEYLETRRSQDEEQTRGSASLESAAVRERERRRREAELRQERYRRTRPIQEKLHRLEQDIARLEREKEDIESLMGKPDFYRDGDHVRDITARYKNVREEIDSAYHRWGKLTAELEERSKLDYQGGGNR